MALSTINNGAFDNDPSAEKIRLAFDRVKAMFDEIYGKIPLDLTGEQGKILVVKATEDGFELVALSGGGDMLSTNNGSDFTDPSAVRTNLGLGTLATLDLIDEDDMVSDSATDVPSQQSVKAYVDNNITTYSAGTGIAISLEGVISNNDVSDNIDTITFAPSTGILTITLESAATATVDLSAYTVLKIDGVTVEKGSGNTNFAAIEVGDRVNGWISTTRYVAGVVNALPWDTEGNLNNALDGET